MGLMSLAQLQSLKSQLIRKALTGSVFVAPLSAPAIDTTTLFDAVTGDLKPPLPTGYGDLGKSTTDGAQFARAITSSDISSWGSTEPSRSDVTSDVKTLQVTSQETNLRTLGMWIGVDTDVLDAAGANGVVDVPEAELPKPVYYRTLMLAADEIDEGEIVLGRFMPRAKVTAFDNQTYANGDTPIQYPMTLTGYTDDTLGYAHRWLFGGAGWLAILQDMGFTAPV